LDSDLKIVESDSDLDLTVTGLDTYLASNIPCSVVSYIVSRYVQSSSQTSVVKGFQAKVIKSDLVFKNTRLPSSLRPTTRKCVHLVTRDHFQSRDKDSGHIIRSVIHANLMDLCFTEPEFYGRSKFYIAEIGIFDFFLL